VIIAGIVLAGGLSRRMGGGDKCLAVLAGRPILAHIIARARPQVTALALNANGDPARFAGFGLPVAADSVADFAGPLAGVLAGLDWACATLPRCTHVASFAGDAPFLPLDLVARLAAALADGSHDLACAASGGRTHPVFGLWPVALRDDLRRALEEQAIRKVDAWTSRHRLATVDFAATPVDPFFNTNRPEDLAEAELLASRVPERVAEAAASRSGAPRSSRL
jgi:molybdopterin-guanine dinucleotide biosynthesis protein A